MLLVIDNYKVDKWISEELREKKRETIEINHNWFWAYRKKWGKPLEMVLYKLTISNRNLNIVLNIKLSAK